MNTGTIARQVEVQMTIQQTLIRFSTIVLVAGAIASLGAAPSYAKYVEISGTHTKSEIKDKCDAAGGTMIQGDGGKGYGCFNHNKQTLVTCNDKGECGGWVPRVVGPVDPKGAAAVGGMAVAR